MDVLPSDTEIVVTLMSPTTESPQGNIGRQTGHLDLATCGRTPLSKVTNRCLAILVSLAI